MPLAFLLQTHIWFQPGALGARAQYYRTDAVQGPPSVNNAQRLAFRDEQLNFFIFILHPTVTRHRQRNASGASLHGSQNVLGVSIVYEQLQPYMLGSV